jgi:uroporphyrinogen III methyltransferase/synthase
MSSQLVILTGHEKLDKDKSSHDWAALAKMGTLSIVMGAANLAQICQKLMANGKDPQTPAAMIEKGATPAQRVVIGTISELPTLAAQAGLSPPSLVVVGQVVKLRQTLNWFEERPLWGRKVMVTRTRAQAGRLSSLLKDLGAQVIERPVIRIEPIAPNPALEIVLDNLINFNWLILTSPNGASFFLNSLFARGFDARSLSGLKIAVIGPATGEALAPYGLKPDLTPLTYMAEGLLESFKEVKPGRLILARAEGARDVLPVGLKNFGFEVTELNLYRTLPALNFGDPLTFKELKKNPPHLTTLTSASSAKALASVIGQADRFLFPVCSIGPITSLAAQEFGFTVAAQSQQASILSMVSAMTEYFKRVEYSYEPWI